MNLFHPKGQHFDSGNMTFEVTEGRDGQSLLNLSPNVTNRSSIVNIQGIFKDEGGQAQPGLPGCCSLASAPVRSPPAAHDAEEGNRPKKR